MALRYLRDQGNRRPTAIITDSALCHGVLMEGHLPTLNVQLFRDVRMLIRTASFTTRIYWTPGHMGIDGNEKADANANIGSKNSTINRYHTTTLTHPTSLPYDLLPP